MKAQPLPRVHFAPEIEDCPECGGTLRIQKSQRRRVITLAHGAFKACEVPAHGHAVVDLLTVGGHG
ncbi:MAG: hypothetical protein KAY24_17015 [Candidatus Eisenbacteria sp.]|nr:hypothetical protein [Candidatus Eisenbacteria bacterium]